MFRGKKYQDSAKQIDKANLYDTAEAMDLIVKTAPAKFDETVELHVKLGVDSRHADQQVRGAIVLPHGTGKVPRVLVFAKGDKADAAKEAGADYVGEADLAQKIQQENWFDFDVVIASPDMMSVVGRLGKVLGPKGLMPSPKAGTVTPNVAGAVQEAKAGKVEYRLDKTNIIHCPIGKVSFGAEKLGENFSTLMGAILWPPPWAPASRSTPRSWADFSGFSQKKCKFRCHFPERRLTAPFRNDKILQRSKDSRCPINPAEDAVHQIALSMIASRFCVFWRGNVFSLVPFSLWR